MTRRPRARKWAPCTGCGQPTRYKGLCPTCVEQGPPAPEPEPEPARNGSAPRRRRRIDSGWCQTGRHGRCPHLMQEANEKRPEISCGCKCHKLVRAMAWAQRR